MLFKILFLVLSFQLSAFAMTCPAGIGASEGEDPKLEQDLGKNGILLVCGFGSAEGDAGRMKLSEFEVYHLKENDIAPQKIFGGSALENYEVIKWSSGLLFQQIEYVGKKEVKTFEKSLSCDKGKCKFEKEKCIFSKFKNVSPKGFQELKTYINGKNKGRSPDEGLIISAVEYALSGNAEALGFFKPFKPNLKLDGAPAETFGNFHRVITKLRAQNCL